MTARGPSLLSRIIETAAERLAQDPRIPDDARVAFRQTAVSVIECTIRDMIGGDVVRVRGWIVTPSDRAARQERIYSSDQAAVDVAQREGVSARWVRKLRRRGPKSSP